MVIGSGPVAGAENCTPVRSMRVEGPGTERRSMPSMKRAATMSISRP